MSYVAADFPTQASNAVLSKAGRQGQAAQKAPSGQFDDLLSAIPDAPPEPRERAAAPPERPRPAETRSERSARPQGAERPAKSESRAPDPKVPAPADDTAPKEAAPADSETATDTQAVVTEKPAKAEDGEATAADSEAVDTSAATQAAVNALVAPAAVIEPAAVVPAAEISLEGETAAKSGAGKADIAAVTNAAATATRNAEQQSAVLTDQTTGLSAEDADVLAALAVTAAKNVKDGQGDKAAPKTEGDKPAATAKLTGDAATPAAATGAPAQTGSGEGDAAGAKTVQSELAKIGVEHQRGQGDANARPGAEQAAPTAATNTAAVKTPDMFATHLLSATVHTAQAATAVSRSAPSQTGDKPVPMSDVGVEITAKIAAGRNQFDIRLDPADLGRIHVKVNVDRDGNITTHMMADRPETLDLLRRDTQGLERALQDAGLKTSDNSLQFSLRDQTQQQQQQSQNDGQASRLIADDETATTLTTTVIARDYGRTGARPSGLDIRV